MAAWKTVATVLIVIFAIVLVQATLASPLIQFQTDLAATGDYSNEHYDGEALMDGMVGDWFNMGLVAIFGMMLYGLARVVRRELTRGGGGGFS